MTSETAPKPCPHCGCHLLGGERDNADGAGDFFFYHPESECFAVNAAVWPHNIDAWNTRAASAQDDMLDALRVVLDAANDRLADGLGHELPPVVRDKIERAIAKAKGENNA